MTRHIVTVCLGIMLLGALCSVPAAADIPTGIVDQYWVWYPVQVQQTTGTPGYWVNPINELGVGAPIWRQDGTSLDILNVEVPNRIKNIWVEVKYVLPQTRIAELVVVDPAGVQYEPVKSWISTNGQFVTWEWSLPYQPALETVNFGTADFYSLRGIELVEVGTQCVPEPASIMLLATGVVGCGFLRRRR